MTLRRKDLRDQLSKNDFWNENAKQQRIGRVQSRPWGIIVDKHPLGYQQVSDKDLAEAAGKSEKVLDDIGLHFGKSGDPRKGPLFGIIERLLEEEKHSA